MSYKVSISAYNSITLRFTCPPYDPCIPNLSQGQTLKFLDEWAAIEALEEAIEKLRRRLPDMTLPPRNSQ